MIVLLNTIPFRISVEDEHWYSKSLKVDGYFHAKLEDVFELGNGSVLTRLKYFIFKPTSDPIKVIHHFDDRLFIAFSEGDKAGVWYSCPIAARNSTTADNLISVACFRTQAALSTG